MGYVYYQPRQQSSQQQNQRRDKYKVQEAERSPFGKFAAWAINKAAGTALEKVVKFFLGGNIIGGLATAITLGLLVGAITDLVIVSIPALSATTFFNSPISIPIIVSVVVGAGTGGLGGAILGGLWGWLISQIIDAATAESVSHQLHNIHPIISWLIATLSGALAGKTLLWIYNKVGKSCASFIARSFLLIALAAVSYFIFNMILAILK